MGLAQPPLTTLVASAVPQQDHGIAMATTTGIGAVAGVSILTALCADAGSSAAFRDGDALGASVAAGGVLAAFGLRAVDYDPDSAHHEDPDGASASGASDGRGEEWAPAA